MELKNLPTEIPIKENIKKENSMARGSMCGLLDQVMKGSFWKEKNMEKENGNHKLENFILEIIFQIKNTGLGDINGKMDVSMKVSSAMIESIFFLM